jgi:hypothetical protein
MLIYERKIQPNDHLHLDKLKKDERSVVFAN